jgi:hypothetical protein
MSIIKTVAIAALGITLLSSHLNAAPVQLTETELDTVTAGKRYVILAISSGDNADGVVNAYLTTRSAKKVKKAVAKLTIGEPIDLAKLLRLTKVRRSLGRLDIRDFPAADRFAGYSAKERRRIAKAKVVHVTTGPGRVESSGSVQVVMSASIGGKAIALRTGQVRITSMSTLANPVGLLGDYDGKAYASTGGSAAYVAVVRNR